jgi:hypothetical protein
VRGGRDIEELELATTPFEDTGILQVQKPRYQTLDWMEDERMKRALRPGTLRCRVLS